jgi:hypothetical protein
VRGTACWSETDKLPGSAAGPGTLDTTQLRPERSAFSSLLLLRNQKSRCRDPKPSLPHVNRPRRLLDHSTLHHNDHGTTHASLNTGGIQSQHNKDTFYLMVQGERGERRRGYTHRVLDVYSESGTMEVYHW